MTFSTRDLLWATGLTGLFILFAMRGNQFLWKLSRDGIHILVQGDYFFAFCIIRTVAFTMVPVTYGFLLGRLLRPTSRLLSARRRLWACTAMLLCFTIYWAWGYWRFYTAPFHGGSIWPREFPYPDNMLCALHDWIDRMWLSSLHSFKFDGEMAATLQIVDVVILVSGSLGGMLLCWSIQAARRGAKQKARGVDTEPPAPTSSK